MTPKKQEALDHLRRQLLLAPGLLHLLLAFHDPPRHPPTPGPLRELFHGLRQGEAWRHGGKVPARER